MEYASESDRRMEEAERDRYDDIAAQVEVKIPECHPAEVAEVHGCANCGRVSEYMDELLRPCGDSRGEWYCYPGEGCAVTSCNCVKCTTARAKGHRAKRGA
jgi:hypothetical protein